MSIKEVMEKYNLSYSQVKGVIRNARDKGVLPRPTRGEISQKLRTSHLGKPSPRKDKRISADTLIAKLSSTKGEDLSESEKAYFRALVKAREIVDTVRVPRLEELYQQYKRKLNKGKQGKRLNLLEMIYASLVSSGLADSEHNFSYLSLMDVLTLYNSKYNQHIDLNNLVDDVHFISTALNNILPDSNLRINSDVDQFFLCGKAEIPEKYLDLLAKFFLPVLLRGGTMDDVAKISGHDYEVIEEVISHLTRRGLFSMNVNCSENASYVVQKDNATEDNQENYLRMARSLISQELLSNSLSSWEELHKLYRSYQRSLPSFVERIILEVFLIARKQAMNMDKSLLESYILTGETVDKEWFETSSFMKNSFLLLGT
ncbi:MAG: helix-turn-helix domain-containing protein [Nitrososphaeria archaeon]